jgi:hypothetical protein
MKTVKANLTLVQSNYLGDLAAGIREDHDAVEQSKSSGLKHAIAAGKKLIEAKRQVKEEHGSWIEWVEENCKFELSTAQKYMRVSKIRNAVPHLSFREAIKQTVKKKRPKKTDDISFTPMQTLTMIRRQYVTQATILTVSERRSELIALAHGMGFDIEIKAEPLAANLTIPGFKKPGS